MASYAFASPIIAATAPLALSDSTPIPNAMLRA